MLEKPLHGCAGEAGDGHRLPVEHPDGGSRLHSGPRVDATHLPAGRLQSFATAQPALLRARRGGVGEVLSPPRATAVLELLRQETGPQHRSIERNRLLSRLVRPTLTREVYVEVLSRFYGFFQPLEQVLLRHAGHVGVAMLLKDRLKTPLLEQDLVRMGFTPAAVGRMPLCDELPCPDCPSACMGILYVTEGSTLGGQVIAATVRKSLGIDADSGGAYFNGYGAATRIKWQETCEAIEACAQDHESGHAAIVGAAAATFDTLNQWLKAA